MPKCRQCRGNRSFPCVRLQISIRSCSRTPTPTGALTTLPRRWRRKNNVKWIFCLTGTIYPVLGVLDPHWSQSVFRIGCGLFGEFGSRSRFVIRIPNIGHNADPDPPDSRVFGPPGSGSIIQRYGSGSGSFYH